MNANEFYGESMIDYELPPEFVKQCKDPTIPVSVLGNGGSLNTLTDEQVTNINNSRLFRCNWAFKDPGKIKTEYAIYFSQAYNGPTEQKLKSQVDNAIETGRMTVYRYIFNVLYNYNPMCSLISSDGIAVWPTSGIQMLLHAAFIIRPGTINIAGIDMYTYKRKKLHLSKEETLQYLKKHGKQFSESGDDSSGIGFGKDNMTLVNPEYFIDKIHSKRFTYHNYESDLLLCMNAFTQCMIAETTVNIYQCDVLAALYEIVQDNIELLRDYFTSSTDCLQNLQKLKPSYNTWRLLHNIKKNALPD